VLDWPAGRWLVFAVAAAIGVAAVWNVYRGLSRKFEEDLELGEMTSEARRWIARLGLVGLSSRGVVFGVIAWFLAKAAYEHQAKETVGLGGALAKVASAAYGKPLLAAVAAGLLAFAVFCLAQVRYRDV
jgi:formate hydrogenlyase subunit 3/multisubunit Na+/H+ antiporter MnhD subunit